MPPTPIPKQLYRVPEAMHILSLSRGAVYELLRTGRLRSVKEGAARLVPANAIADYVALLEQEAATTLGKAS
jgi:excisionase family DNA binding protein